MKSGEAIPPSELDIAEACALAAAWITAIAAQRGISALVIKGESLAHHGLRPPRTSADVDILVDPRRFDELRAAVREAGWQHRPSTEVGAIWAPHSETHFHDSWPCDIDIHRFFPGFLADPQTTFDLLWQSRDAMPLAHRTVPVPNRLGSILISGLHQLRDGNARADSVELDNLASIKLSEGDRRELIRLAESTQSIGTARELFVRLGVSGEDVPPVRDSAELREWRARIDANASGAYFWLLLLERTPFRDRLGVLRRALWPPREALLIGHPHVRDTRNGRLRLRLFRATEGIRGLPSAIGAMLGRRSSASEKPE